MTPNADATAEGDDTGSMSRRGFFRAGAAGAAVAAGVAAGSGTAAAQYDGWLEGVSNYDGTHDYRGQDEVTVAVGAGENGLRFGPAAVLVDPGATVIWEWTGQGGGHNVVASDDTFDSGSPIAEEGATFEHTFENAADGDTFNYYCSPHQAVGMKGVVAVGSVDDDLVDPQAGGDGGDGGSGEGSGAAGYGDWFENVGNYEGTRDLRGQSEVTVSVGAGENGLLFDSPAILIDPETTVIWEWTGQGGGHNVVEENDTFSSGSPVAEEGTTFEHAFEDAGEGDVFRYFCGPHRAVGMKGAVAVGAVDDDLIGGNGGDGGSGGGSGDGGLSASDIGALALGFGFAGTLLVPLFYAAHQKAEANA